MYTTTRTISRTKLWVARPRTKPAYRFNAVALVLLSTLVGLRATALAGEPAPRIIYVNQAAVGANNGGSWVDAYLDLQDALDDAAVGCVESSCQIWVAGGTYKPDRETGDRAMTFELVDSVDLFGGFGGWEGCPDERVPGQFPTVLTGDLLDDDDPDAEPTSNCCDHHSGPGCDDAECAALVGSVFPGCNTIAHWHSVCPDLANQLCPDLCRPTRGDNSFVVAIALGFDHETTIDGISIVGGDGNPPPDSTAEWTYTGGVYAQSSTLVFRNCSFRRNSGWTASVTLHLNGNTRFEHCEFDQNSDRYRASPIVEQASTSLEVYDSAFRDSYGSALFLFSGASVVERSTFIGMQQSALQIFTPGTTVRDCVFIGNGGNTLGSAVDNGPYSTLIINSAFLSNHTLGHVVYDMGGLTLANCIFSGNSSTSPTTISSIIHSEGEIVNCTITDNHSVNPDGCGGVAGAMYMIDSILWGNTAGTNTDERAQIRVTGPSTVRYNCIQGYDGVLGGFNNWDVDPQFADPAGPDGVVGTVDDNLRLSPDSPLINLGDPAPSVAAYYDGDRHARTLCGRIDMGAYEFGIGDYNCDRVVELDDYVGFPTCLTGPVPAAPYPSACAAYDFATEITEDVDLLDFAGFQNAPFSDGT